MSFQTYDFLHNTKEDILENIWGQTTLEPVDFHYMDQKHWDIFQNILFYASQKKLKCWQQCEKAIKGLSFFGVNYPLNIVLHWNWHICSYNFKNALLVIIILSGSRDKSTYNM